VLIGRESEQARIEALLRRARDGHGGGLVVRGEPGIGKTALLGYAEAQAAGMRVLRARGVEAEAELAFAGLHELLRPLLPLLDQLPPPQAAALAGALGLGPPIDARLLIAAGTLTLIATAADERPMLLLVDDAHWLDAESADALVFVARRLEADPVLLLLAAREGDTRAFESPAVDELVLRGLAREDAVRLLCDQGMPAGVVEDLHRAAAGNPLALLELPTVLTERQRAGVEPLDDLLPVPDAVQAAFLRQIDALPADTGRALTVAAAEPSAELRAIGRACAGLGIAITALEGAEERGLLALEGGRVAFRHPLVRAAAYHRGARAELRAVHRALADAARADAEDDRRAWHLAAAALGPDEEVAAALERVAEESIRRSGYASAVAAYDRAASLTPEPRAQRLYRATEARLWVVSAAADALARAERALALTVDDDLRFKIQFLRAAVRHNRDPASARPLMLEEVARLEPRDPARAALLATHVARMSLVVGHSERALAEALRARAIAERAGGIDAFLVLTLAAALLANGRVREAAPLMSAAEALLDEVETRFANDVANEMGDFAFRAQLPLQVLLATGRPERVSRCLDAAAAWARNRTALAVYSWTGSFGGRVDFLAGRWASARPRLVEAVQLGRETGLLWQVWSASMTLAELAAARGAADECREHEADAAAAAAAWGAMTFLGDLGRGASALLSLGQKQYDAAARNYERDVLPAAGPLKLYPQVADAIEALVRAGRPADAAPLAAAFAEQAADAGWAWALARAGHLRALLAPSADLFEEALHWHEEATQPFPGARTQLAYGAWLRRTKRRIDARDPLGAALDTFEQLGAEPWADQARAELRATGERVRVRTGIRTDELTAQELEIALTVARGATNKEAAAQLFLSPKTIEKRLGSVYTKLGLRSRTELAAALASPPVASAAPPRRSPRTHCSPAATTTRMRTCARGRHHPGDRPHTHTRPCGGGVLRSRVAHPATTCVTRRGERLPRTTGHHPGPSAHRPRSGHRRSSGRNHHGHAVGVYAARPLARPSADGRA
jgi:DNA-binding CsgD family transcriptional regulator